MKEKIEDVTQSPLEVELRDGKTYKLSPVGFVDYGDFAQYLKAKKLELCNRIEDDNTRMQMIEKIMSESIDYKKLIAEYSSVDGIIYMTWKAIQKNHPEVKLKDMNNLVDIENFNEISVVIGNLGGKVKNQKGEAKKK